MHTQTGNMPAGTVDGPRRRTGAAPGPGPVVDALVALATARARREPPPGSPTRAGGGSLVVVRVPPGGCRLRRAAALAAQLARAARSVPCGAEAADGATGPLLWPSDFGAELVAVDGAADAVLWAPPGTRGLLVLAGTCHADEAWRRAVRGVVEAHRPVRLHVTAVDRIGPPHTLRPLLEGVAELGLAGRTVSGATVGSPGTRARRTGGGTPGRRRPSRHRRTDARATATGPGASPSAYRTGPGRGRPADPARPHLRL